MRRLIALLAGLQLVLAFGLIATAPTADATSSLWSTTSVSASAYYVCCQPVHLTPKCASGSTPITAGWVVDAGANDVRRLTEYVNFGDGGSYDLLLDASNASFTTPIHVVATVVCLRSSAFSSSVLKVGTFTTGSNDIATGTVQCDPGWTALTGSVDPTGSGGTTLTSTPSNGGTAWTARTWSSDVGSNNYLFVHCVPTANIPGPRWVTHSDAAGWGSGASASCAAGMRPIAGGTYHSGGDSGAISVDSHPTSTGWSSVTETLNGGTITTSVLCVPSADPHVNLSSYTTPAANSNTVHWDFTVTDPAAGSGFTTVVKCQLLHGVGNVGVIDEDWWQPCSSPVERANRVDGWNQLNVVATTSDGREYIDSDSILVDTTPPVVTFDDPAGKAYGSQAPSIPVHATDNFYLQDLTCSVDGAAATTCGNSTQGAKLLALTGLSDGTHTLHVTATDSKTNTAGFDDVFKVDTTAPAAALTAPTSRVTVATRVGLAWSGSDAVAGIASWGSEWESSPYNADFGAWTGTATSPETATGRSVGSLARGSTYCFHVDATDAAGNTSAWSAARCTAIPLDDRDLAASSGWARSAPRGWFNGTALTTTHHGASLALTGVTLDRVALVARKCATCGVVGVYVGGVRIARIDLHSGTSARRTITLPAFSLRTATVSVKVLSSGKTVQVDAVAVSRV
ncbi:hypothetical protein [Nocardioides ultimimeridianus]